MNCLEFRRAIGAQPNQDAEDVRAHAAVCDACASFRRELQEMDLLIHRALRIDLPPEGFVRGQTPGVTRHRMHYWAAAASLLVAVGLGLSLLLMVPTGSLAEQVVEHAHKEAHALVATSDRVDAAALTAIFGGSGVRLKPGALEVSYAMSCWFRGHYVPHLVVQTQHGPVTVLVMRHERTPAHTVAFSEDGYEGRIVPAPKGAIAVLARGAPSTEAAAQLLGVMEYDR